MGSKVKSTESFQAGDIGVQRDPSIHVIVDRNKLIDVDVCDRISLENRRKQKTYSERVHPKFPVTNVLQENQSKRHDTFHHVLPCIY